MSIVNNTHEKAYDLVIILSYILIFLSYFGKASITASYLETINNYVSMYICIFLILRFHPFSKTKFTNLDRKIAFHAGVLLISTTTINAYKNVIINQIKQTIIK